MQLIFYLVTLMHLMNLCVQCGEASFVVTAIYDLAKRVDNKSSMLQHDYK